MSTILVMAGYPAESFGELDGHTIIMPPLWTRFHREDMQKYLPKADALLASGRVNADMLAQAPNLKIIANCAVGFNNVDIAAAGLRRIPVTNTPFSVTLPTAELALALLLSVVRQIPQLDRHMREENTRPYFASGDHMALNLEGRRLGIIGMGRIGSKMAELARMLGMEVSYHNRHETVPGWLPPEDLIKTSDVISIHTPLNDETRNLLSRERLNMMKKGSILINTARGAVVDEEALCDLLECRHLYGAGLDVYPNEPHVNPRLKKLDNVVLQPHMGTNSVHARRNMAAEAAHNIAEFFAGRRPPSVVNPEIYDT